MKEFFTGIDHPALAANDVDELAKWYCNVLGYKEFHRNDKPVWMLQAPDGSLIEIMPKDETPRPDRTTWTPGWSHLALRVKDIEAAIAALNQHQVQWMGDTVEAIGGGKVRAFQDPDGNMLQVVERNF